MNFYGIVILYACLIAVAYVVTNTISYVKQNKDADK